MNSTILDQRAVPNDTILELDEIDGEQWVPCEMFAGTLAQIREDGDDEVTEAAERILAGEVREVILGGGAAMTFRLRLSNPAR